MQYKVKHKNNQSVISLINYYVNTLENILNKLMRLLKATSKQRKTVLISQRTRQVVLKYGAQK